MHPSPSCTLGCTRTSSLTHLESERETAVHYSYANSVGKLASSHLSNYTHSHGMNFTESTHKKTTGHNNNHNESTIIHAYISEMHNIQCHVNRKNTLNVECLSTGPAT